MTLLTYNNKYVVQSTISVTTTSSILVDDTEAIQTFSLDSPKTVLVMYQANSEYLALVYSPGIQNAISIDGTDVSRSYDTKFDGYYPVRNSTFWIGTLNTGSHTIKGRFAATTSGLSTIINNRILLIYIFNGDEFQYIDNEVNTVSTTSLTFVDDIHASTTFTPSGNCKALYLYNCSNTGATEYIHGKKTVISVGGVDQFQAEKSALSSGYSDSIFNCYANSLTPVPITVKGRFANGSTTARTVTIHSRQLGVLLFNDSTLLDIVTSNIQSSITSSTLSDDPNALISRITTENRELLTIAIGTKRHGIASAQSQSYGISVDNIDRQTTKAGPGSSVNNAVSEATCWASSMPTGSHTIKGRFADDEPLSTLSSRILMALWLTSLPPSCIKPICNFVVT